MISESVENKANEVLLGVLQSVDQAGDFVVTQAPDVIRELLLWHTIDSLIGFGFGVLLLMSSPIAWIKLSRWGKKRKDWAKSEYERDERWTRCSPIGSEVLTLSSGSYDCIMATSGILAPIVGILGLIFGLSFTFGNLVWLKIMVAPKLYLLEYAAKLVQ